MNPETQQLSRRTASMSDEEFAQRHRAASEEACRATFPLIRWLCAVNLTCAKVTIIQSRDGTIERKEEYPPDVAESVEKMHELIKTVRESIWAHHFPKQ